MVKKFSVRRAKIIFLLGIFIIFLSLFAGFLLLGKDSTSITEVVVIGTGCAMGGYIFGMGSTLLEE